ncbi:MAG: 1-acyl-sn-glycerol-3-phosphate acyltransferase [Verrucomicrobiota bacterium]|nr:1-acyl-sn-glycerol-3-phosphate acyltransferase [Verrucomicrobiota bacterium]
MLRQKLSPEGNIPAKYREILLPFVACYRQALGPLFQEQLPTLLLFLELIQPHFSHPHLFPPYHQKIRHPFDYYSFGLDFIRPLIEERASKIYGEEHWGEVVRAVRAGENAILLSNHQTESDPQAISILLEKKYADIAEKIIYVAGERVLTDPLAIPFSMGCDLLCIYSRRYIDTPPECREQKLLHNRTTMEKMARLLGEGGKVIYVAPSGGRDRKNAAGKIEVAPFDPDSIALFHLMAKKGGVKTHFVPFALSTHDLLPPPEAIQKELGEARIAKRTPVFLSFAPPYPMEVGGKEGREERAKEIWTIVKRMYEACPHSIT